MLLNEKKLRLGRGLGALIPGAEEDTNEPEIKELNPLEIQENPYQPRKYFNDEKIKELAISIKEHGVNQPILVRENDGQYQLIAGERRLRACKLLNLEKIPTIIKNISDEDAIQISIIENIQREDISPTEEAQAYKVLIDRYKYTHQQLSNKLGKSRPAISNSLRLLELPEEIINALNNNLISVGHARALLALPVNEQRIEMLHNIVNKKLSVRQTESAVKSIIELRPSPNIIKENIFKDKEEYIKTNFWKDFSFQGSEKNGKLIFKYSSLTEKEELLKKLGF